LAADLLCGAVEAAATPHFPQLAPASLHQVFGPMEIQPDWQPALHSQIPRQNRRAFRLQKLTHFPLQQAPVLAARINKKRQAQQIKKRRPLNQPAT
jgi:hypothetical protein